MKGVTAAIVSRRDGMQAAADENADLGQCGELSFIHLEETRNLGS
jgi:hypothetical protein